jgi:hypothetical protein
MAKTRKVHEIEEVIKVEQIQPEKITPEPIEVEKIEPVKIEKSEHRSAGEIYDFVCELLEDSLRLQQIEAQAGRTPTELAITSHQLLMCKNNIARALGK